MASVLHEFTVSVSADRVWDAVRDFGAVHRRLVPGFVTDCVSAPGERTVTFASGLVARELLVGIDEPSRRLAYSVVGGRASHHQASVQVVDDGTGRTRIVWITDVLPDPLAEPIGAMMAEGARVMRATLSKPGD